VPITTTATSAAEAVATAAAKLDWSVDQRPQPLAYAMTEKYQPGHTNLDDEQISFTCSSNSGARSHSSEVAAIANIISVLLSSQV
jgi:hypothetical protein